MQDYLSNMKVSKLDIEYHYDFLLYGLISSHREYKVAWMLNQLLSLDLELNAELEINYKNNKQLQICNYVYTTDYVTFRLLKNKASESEKIVKPYLIPELKQYDYFLMVEGDEDILDRQDFKKPLKESDFFIYTDQIKAENLKSKENLIF